MGCSYQAPLLVCLPTPVYILYLLAYWPRPVQANKKSAPVLSEREMLYQKKENKNDANDKRAPKILMLYQNSP